MKKLTVLSLTLLFWCCSKKQIPADESLLGLDYYPTSKGRYVVYEVDSTVYGEIPRDTNIFRYQVKERIGEEFTDNLGRPAFRLERFIRHFDPAKPYASLPWQVKEVWMVNADKISVQVVEGNVRFTKLIFPVQEKAGWDGNMHNSQGEMHYQYEYIDEMETIGNNKLNKVLKVRQQDFRTLISLDTQSEKYAKGVGLVEREIVHLLSNNIVAGQPVEQRIESGIIFKQTLVSYGTE